MGKLFRMPLGNFYETNTENSGLAPSLSRRHLLSEAGISRDETDVFALKYKL
jgi:hypothetical protein